MDCCCQPMSFACVFRFRVISMLVGMPLTLFSVQPQMGEDHVGHQRAQVDCSKARKELGLKFIPLKQVFAKRDWCCSCVDDGQCSS